MSMVTAPPPPPIRLSIGVTGHRGTNPAFAANRDAIEAALHNLFGIIDTTVANAPVPAGEGRAAPTRLHSLLVDGLDQVAARQGLDRGWEIVAPLPFGRRLNTVINARPHDGVEARQLLRGETASNPATQAAASDIAALTDRARVFELADRDDAIAALFLARRDAPADMACAQAYSFAASERVALAAEVMIEQSDLIIGVWDGGSTSFIGGTGHTIALALDRGAPVLWVDARAPARVRLLRAPETLAAIMAGAVAENDGEGELVALVQDVLKPTPGSKSHDHQKHLEGLAALDTEQWRPRSSRFWHGYRRIEALFGADDNRGRFRSLVQTYETPDEIADGSAAAQMAAAAALPGQDMDFIGHIRTDVLRRFAWADGISARLSDTYRGGMILNFLFSSLAIVGGIAYLPFATMDDKWAFAVFELALLAAILVITFVGQAMRWHGRWFETRRVAEYLRHAPILLVLGVARPAGRWPRGAHTSWPEYYARHALRDAGLPRVTVTADYISGALSGLLLPHVTSQRDYHRAKAHRLETAHHRLDKLSEAMFTLAVVSVSCYLALKLAGQMGLISPEIAHSLSKTFTFFGVLLPTFGGAISGIRFFGDFERFSAISEVTAEKLDAVARRLELLLAAPAGAIDHARAAELAHATDDIVIGEIESWQAVFGGKHITVPV
ncbi:MAG: hypothetical protein H7268_16805 [Sandarakinorhabdus sp.]|nr:hypothetical protein [Sandarakinorhabdus sp.]